MKSPILALLLTIISTISPCCQAAHTPASSAPSANSTGGTAVSEQTAEWLLKVARSELTGKQAASQPGQSSGPAQSIEPIDTTLFLTAFYHSFGAAAFSNSASSLL